MSFRDHDNITIEEFNGLWKRGGADSTPPDHFSDCNNVKYIESGFQTRDGINVLVPGYVNVLKVYNYPKITTESLLILDTSGNIYDSGFGLTPILTVSGMTDFGLAIYAGRAYISPAQDFQLQGIPNQFIYVYQGDGTPARKAAGDPPIDADGAIAAANGGAGHVEAGIHIFGAVYETDTGFETQIGPDTLAQVTATGTSEIDLTNIPTSPNSFVTKVHIVATKAIDPTLFTGNTRGYQFFFVPDAIVNNGTTTLSVDFYDIELLADASHLLDLLSEIPAALSLTLYHGRMIASCFHPDEERSLVRVSYPGEVEAFDAVTGLIQLQANNQPITRCRELRDVLYIFKDVQTFAVNDNGDVPSSWNVITLDQGLGATVHGVAEVLDTGGVDLDYLIITNPSGCYLFNGTYQFPELSYKIADFWTSLSFDDFIFVEIYQDTLLKRLYIIMPNQQVLMYADYQHGLDSEKIRWGPFTADITFSSICLTQFNKLIIGAKQAAV
jgi:hypothetical protein